MGRSGWLTLCTFSVESLEQSEDHLIVAAETDEGEPLDPEPAARLMTLPGTVSPLAPDAGPDARQDPLAVRIAEQRGTIERGISERNARFFEAEAQKLDGWADDLKVGLEREI